MKRLRGCTFGLAVVLALSFLVTEGAIFSMASSAFMSRDRNGNTELFDKYRVHVLSMTGEVSLLAAGDVAACNIGSSSDRLIRNMQYSLGIERRKLEPNKGMLATTKILESHPSLAVIALGDLAYKRGEPVSFEDCYSPYWGIAKDRTWPLPGNHEYQSLGAYGYFDYWGERAGPDRKGYYALKAGNWILLALNSERDASKGSEQAEWIDRVLTEHDDLCVGAFFHRPAFSAVERGGGENARLLFALMVEARAVFVVNGHNHFFERTVQVDELGQPSVGGTMIFVAGAGGDVAKNAPARGSRTAELIATVPGMLKIDLLPDSMRWNYLVVDEPKPQSSGSLACS